MCEIETKVTCPHCQSSKIVKNGHKKDGTQNFLCKNCRKQFQFSYQNKGLDPSIKHLIISMLLRNSGILDIETVLGVSRKRVLNTLLAEAKRYELSPLLKHYQSVQIDEFWSYVHQRKNVA